MSVCMITPAFTFDKLLQRLQLDEGVAPFVIWREKDLFGTHDNPVKIDLPLCLPYCKAQCQLPVCRIVAV